MSFRQREKKSHHWRKSTESATVIHAVREFQPRRQKEMLNMPLFSRVASVPRPVTVKYVPVPVFPQYLPAQYRNLPCACPRHGVPVPMRFDGFTKSDGGSPVARYTC